MISVKSVESQVAPYGFTIYATSLSTLHFIDDVGINLKVNIFDNSFELSYIVDGIFTLTSGSMSPFYEEKPKYRQFIKMYARFLTNVAVLKESEEQ